MELGYDYIGPLNNDTIIDPHFLDRLVSVLRGRPDAGAASPLVYQLERPGHLDSAGLEITYGPHICRHRGYGERDRGQYDSSEELESFSGSAFLLRRTVLDEVGLFDESYFAYGEDIDLAVRIRKRGYKILLVPTAKVWHKLSATGGSSPNVFKANLVGRNAVRFMKKHASARDWTIFLTKCAFAFPGVFIRYVARGDLMPLLAKMRSGISALIGSN